MRPFINQTGNGDPPPKRQRREVPVEQDPVDDAPQPAPTDAK